MTLRPEEIVEIETYFKTIMRERELRSDKQFTRLITLAGIAFASLGAALAWAIQSSANGIARDSVDKYLHSDPVTQQVTKRLSDANDYIIQATADAETAKALALQSQTVIAKTDEILSTNQKVLSSLNETREFAANVANQPQFQKNVAAVLTPLLQSLVAQLSSRITFIQIVPITLSRSNCGPRGGFGPLTNICDINFEAPLPATVAGYSIAGASLAGPMTGAGYDTVTMSVVNVSSATATIAVGAPGLGKRFDVQNDPSQMGWSWIGKLMIFYKPAT